MSTRRTVRITFEPKSLSDSKKLLNHIAKSFPADDLDINLSGNKKEVEKAESKGEVRRDEILEIKAIDEVKSALAKKEEDNLGKPKPLIPKPYELVEDDLTRYRKAVKQEGVIVVVKALAQAAFEYIAKIYTGS